MAYILIRKKCRDNIISLLTGNTAVGNNVFQNREEPLFPEETEAVNIYTRDGTPIYNKKLEKHFKRELQIFIEVLARKTTQYPKSEDRIETITGQIEDILLPNDFLQYPPPENLQSGTPVTAGDEIIDNIRVGGTSEGKTPEGLADVASLITEFIVEYTYEVQVGSAVDFDTGDIQYDLEGEQAIADQAHDRVTITQ